MAELFFGDVRFDTRKLELRGPRGAIELRARARELLVLLIENRHRFVPKEEILQTVWSGVRVADSSVAQCVSELRHALGDDPKQPRYIETRIKAGYRFIAPLYHKPTERLEPLPWRESTPSPADSEPETPAGGRWKAGTLRVLSLAALLVVLLAAGSWFLKQRAAPSWTLYVPPATTADESEASLAAAAAFDRLAAPRLGALLGRKVGRNLPPPGEGEGWWIDCQCRNVHALRLEVRVALRRWPTGEERWGWTWSGPPDTSNMEQVTEEILVRLSDVLKAER